MNNRASAILEETPFSRFVADFLSSRLAVLGLTLLGIVIFIAILAPWISPQNPYDLSKLDRLPLAGREDILGVEISKVEIPVMAGRNLAVLVEAAARNFVLQQRGIDTMQEFISRHEQQMLKD